VPRRSPTTVVFPRDWIELMSALRKHRVRFVVVGAHALAVHGRPRATGDLDVFIEPTRANTARLAEALRDFGAPGYAAAASQLARRDRMTTLGREPLRIDLMSSVSGVGFATAWRGRTTGRVEGLEGPIPFLGLRELARNKRASGRPKDLADLALMEEAGLIRRR